MYLDYRQLGCTKQVLEKYTDLHLGCCVREILKETQPGLHNIMEKSNFCPNLTSSAEKWEVGSIDGEAYAHIVNFHIFCGSIARVEDVGNKSISCRLTKNFNRISGNFLVYKFVSGVLFREGWNKNRKCRALTFPEGSSCFATLLNRYLITYHKYPIPLLFICLNITGRYFISMYRYSPSNDQSCTDGYIAWKGQATARYDA